MRRALVLAGVALLLATEARAQQADTDPWFGHDKALHFAASASLATDSRPTRVVVGASFALGVGVLKEVWDLTGHGDASWRDLTWDLVGTTTGILVAYAIDWMILRLRTPAPAP